MLPGILPVCARILWHEWLYRCDELTHCNVVLFQKCTIDWSSTVINQCAKQPAIFLQKEFLARINHVPSQQLHRPYQNKYSFLDCRVLIINIFQPHLTYNFLFFIIGKHLSYLDQTETIMNQPLCFIRELETSASVGVAPGTAWLLNCFDDESFSALQLVVEAFWFLFMTTLMCNVALFHVCKNIIII